VAVNALFGDALPEQQLVLAGLKSEGTVSGYHADNIAPAIMGGFTLVRWAPGALPTIKSRIAHEWWQAAAHESLHAVSREILSAECVL
jgi:homoserine kinase